MRQSHWKSLTLATLVAASASLAMLLADAAPVLGATDVCPSSRGTLCVEAIRSAVDRAAYSDALEMAEAQCDTTPARTPEERLGVEALVAQSSGCYWVYVIERFLGRSLTAIEARDKAKRIAALGCEHGLDDLCEILLGLVDRQLDEILGEVRTNLRNPAAAPLRTSHLRTFDGGRELPRGFFVKASQRLKEAFQAEGAPLLDCEACRKARSASSAQGAMTADLPASVLDARLVVEGSDLSLTLKTFDTRAGKVTWEKTWRMRDLAERQRLYGFNATVPESVATARQIEAWEPDYHTMIGLGVARLPNTSGGTSDSQRLAVQIRAGERFHDRRTEVGLLMSAHVTQRVLMKRYGRGKDEIEAAPEDGETDAEADSEASDEAPVEEGDGETTDLGLALDPYATAVGLYGYLGRHLTGSTVGYGGIRSGVTLGYGGIIATNLIAPSARLSLEVYFGRRFAVSPAALWVGRSVYQSGDGGEERTKPVVGSECVFSLNF